MDMILEEIFNHNLESDIWNDQLNGNWKEGPAMSPTDISHQKNQEKMPELEFQDIGQEQIMNQIGQEFIWDCQLPEIMPYRMESRVSEYDEDRILKGEENREEEYLNEPKIIQREPIFERQKQNSQNDKKLWKLSQDFLKTKPIKKGWKKNTNLPKFLVRIYMKYYQLYSKDQSTAALSFFKRVKKQIKAKGSNAYKISDVLRFFENQKRPNPQLGKNNREAMARILRDTSQEEIVDSNYINGNLRSYLMRSKVYALRCRNKNLAQRIKLN